MTRLCDVDWSATAAWVQAVFSVVAIAVAIWIPSRERAQRRQQDLASQRAALVAIARRGRTAIARLKARSQAGALERDLLGWLREEIAAISAIADRVDLTGLHDASLVETFAEVQEACRTAHRRLRYVSAKASRDDRTVPVATDRFHDPAARIDRAIATLAADKSASGPVARGPGGS